MGIISGLVLKKYLSLWTWQSGLASAWLALKNGLKCTLCDESVDFEKRLAVQKLIESGAHFCKVEDLQSIEFDTVVMSPGISPSKQIYKSALNLCSNFMGS